MAITVVGLGLKVNAGLEPHPLFALTEIVVEPGPGVRTMLDEVLDPVQPPPVTVQVYDVAPLTAATV